MSIPLQRIVDTFGTPCFVYDWDAIVQRAASLRVAFGGRFALSYAVKSNPNHWLLERLRGVVDTLDISSGGELTRSRHAGWDAGLISFTGPGKTDRELRAAVDAEIDCVIVESIGEAERLAEFARQAGRKQGILVRIAPAQIPAGFGVGMAGKPCQFGIDEEVAVESLERILALPSLQLKGFHIYSGTQCLKAEAISQNYTNFIRIFRELSEHFDLAPEKLVFGSALGVPYYTEDKPLNLAAVAEATNPQLDALKAETRFAKTALYLELGRYLVGEAGRYLTRVLHIKASRGAHIAVCDGGMNHHLAACGHMGTVIPRNYRISKLGGTGEPRSYEVFGPLCTTIDRLARNLQVPELHPGDVLSVECSGAYGLTASPVHFISHEPAWEIAIERIGEDWALHDVSGLPKTVAR